MLFLTFLGLSAFSAVQSASTDTNSVMCYVETLTDKDTAPSKEAPCNEGVKQCTKSTAGVSIGNNGVAPRIYACASDATIKKEGCTETETTTVGVTTKTEMCVCTGSLCNSASSNRVNFIMMAFSSFMMACLKFTF